MRGSPVRVLLVAVLAACVGRTDFAAPSGSPNEQEPSCAAGQCASRCGTLADLEDDFEDGVRGEVWEWSWSNGGGASSEEAGALRLSHPDGDAGAAYVTSEHFRTDESHVTLKLRSSNVREASSSFSMVLISGAAEVAYLMQVVDAVYVGVTDGATTTNLTPLSFDFAQQRWWRVAVRDGVFHGELSPDGATWTEVGRLPLPSTLSMARVAIQVAGAGAGAAEVQVEQVNGAGAGAFPGCSAATLIDELDDGRLDPLWIRSFENGPALLEEDDGVVTIAPAAGAGSSAGLYATNRYSLEEASITAHVVSVLADHVNHESTFRLDDPSGVISSFSVRDGRMLALFHDGAPQIVADVPFDAAGHVCWRFRGDGDDLVWEVAGAGCAAFVVLGRVTSSHPKRALAPMLFAGAFSGSESPGAMIIERVFGE